MEAIGIGLQGFAGFAKQSFPEGPGSRIRGIADGGLQVPKGHGNVRATGAALDSRLMSRESRLDNGSHDAGQRSANKNENAAGVNLNSVFAGGYKKDYYNDTGSNEDAISREDNYDYDRRSRSRSR